MITTCKMCVSAQTLCCRSLRPVFGCWKAHSIYQPLKPDIATKRIVVPELLNIKQRRVASLKRCFEITADKIRPPQSKSWQTRLIRSSHLDSDCYRHEMLVRRQSSPIRICGSCPMQNLPVRFPNRVLGLFRLPLLRGAGSPSRAWFPPKLALL